MRVKVIVHPNSKKPRVEKDALGVLHIHVSEQPHDGKANEAVIEVLAGYCDVPKTTIKLLKGHTSKQKTFEIK